MGLKWVGKGLVALPSGCEALGRGWPWVASLAAIEPWSRLTSDVAQSMIRGN